MFFVFNSTIQSLKFPVSSSLSKVSPYSLMEITYTAEADSKQPKSWVFSVVTTI